MRKRVVEAFLKSAYDFSSVQMDFPDEIAEEIRAWGRCNIPGCALIDKGFEDDIHVTVKYGIHIVDFTELRELFKDEKPIEVTLGKITLFTSDENDVVKIDVHSSDLVRLNKKISKNFEVTDTHPKYLPHCTIAYVKSGAGAPYDGCTAFEGKKVLLDTVAFSGKDNRFTEFKVKKAYFHQGTWLPGRSTRDYPNFQKSQTRDKQAVYVCISCNLRRFMESSSRCPRCGHTMKKS